MPADAGFSVLMEDNTFGEQEQGRNPGKSENELHNAVIHHFNICSLIEFEDTCLICSVLVRLLWDKYRALFQSDNVERFCTEVNWSNPDMDHSLTLYFTVTDSAAPRDDMNCHHYYRMTMWSQSAFEKYTVEQDNTTTDQSGDVVEVELSTELSGSRELATRWLGACKSSSADKHQECQNRSRDYMPTRLLDARRTQETGKLVLIPTSSNMHLFAENRDHISLSHCWGSWGAVNNPQLKQSNLDDWTKDGLELDRLPQTFQDTVEIASWFGGEWLTIMWSSVSYWVPADGGCGR
jgi:hypothetical protein